MQRPPVTDPERHALNNLVAALATAETFYCSGTALYADVYKPTLMYTTDTGAEALSITKASDKDLDDLHSGCIASHFGQGQDRVLDPSYRLARELLVDNFGLNFNPIGDDIGILAAISAFCKIGVGGHFKVHKDTPKSDNHIGTLLISLPASFEGGQLLLQHGDKKASIDWSRKRQQSREETLSLPWAFFYSDVEHEILPVTSGHRLTLAYDIYSSKSVKYYEGATNKTMEVGDVQFYKEFEAFLKNPQLLPNGGILAFGLAYEYPLACGLPTPHIENAELSSELEESQSDGSADRMACSDAVLYRTLTESNLQVQVKAVYRETVYNYDETTIERLDEFSCFGAGSCHRFVLLTADDFSGIDGRHCVRYEEKKLELLQSEVEAKIGWDVLWVKRPEKFRVASTFASYGNEPSIDHCYVSVALLIDLPPVVDGHRQGY
ncbi:hypothetical protein FRB97_006209 [Tulasnella sp. 331]|nr:hypothetical protein FRB97_006209 [Tulasnella sp. 331]